MSTADVQQSGMQQVLDVIALLQAALGQQNSGIGAHTTAADGSTQALHQCSTLQELETHQPKNGAKRHIYEADDCLLREQYAKRQQKALHQQPSHTEQSKLGSKQQLQTTNKNVAFGTSVPSNSNVLLHKDRHESASFSDLNDSSWRVKRRKSVKLEPQTVDTKSSSSTTLKESIGQCCTSAASSICSHDDAADDLEQPRKQLSGNMHDSSWQDSDSCSCCSCCSCCCSCCSDSSSYFLDDGSEREAGNLQHLAVDPHHLTERAAPAYSFGKATRWPSRQQQLVDRDSQPNIDENLGPERRRQSSVDQENVASAAASEAYALARQIVNNAAAADAAAAREAYARARQVLGLTVEQQVTGRTDENVGESKRFSRQTTAAAGAAADAAARKLTHTGSRHEVLTVTAATTAAGANDTSIPAARTNNHQQQLHKDTCTRAALSDLPSQTGHSDDNAAALDTQEPRSRQRHNSSQAASTTGNKQHWRRRRQQQQQKVAVECKDAHVSTRGATAKEDPQLAVADMQTNLAAALDSVKHRSAATAFAHPSVKEQIRRLLEERKQQKEAAAQAAAAAAQMTRAQMITAVTEQQPPMNACSKSAQMHGGDSSSRGATPSRCAAASCQQQQQGLHRMHGASKFPTAARCTAASSSSSTGPLIGPGSYNVRGHALDVLSYRQSSSRSGAVFAAVTAGGGADEQQVRSRSCRIRSSACIRTKSSRSSSSYRAVGLYATPPRLRTAAAAAADSNPVSTSSPSSTVVSWTALFGPARQQSSTEQEDKMEWPSGGISTSAAAAPAIGVAAATAAGRVGNSGGTAAAAAAGVLSFLTSDLEPGYKMTRPRVKGAVIMPLPSKQQQKQQDIKASGSVAGSSTTSAATVAVEDDAMDCDKVASSDTLDTRTAVSSSNRGDRQLLLSSTTSPPPSPPAAAAAVSSTVVPHKVHNAVHENSMFELDVKFTLVEARVRGVPVMVRPSSNPRSSSNTRRSSSNGRPRNGSSSIAVDVGDGVAAGQFDRSQQQQQQQQSSDVWRLDSSIKPRKPSWKFPPLTPALAAAAGSGSSIAPRQQQQLYDLDCNYDAVRPRVGLGVVKFDGWSATDSVHLGPTDFSNINQTISARHKLRQLMMKRRGKYVRQPGPGSYSITAAWEYLQKHVPGVLLAAAVSHVAAATAAAGGPRQKQHDGQNVSIDQADNSMLYDLTRTLQHIRPRVPAWGFAPLPTMHAVGFSKQQTSRGCLGLEMLYDVKVTLVKRRVTGGAVPFELQLPRSAAAPAAADGTNAGFSDRLGPGCYDLSYNQVENALAKLLLPFNAPSGSSSENAMPPAAAAAAEGDILNLDLDAAYNKLSHHRNVHESNTVQLRLMLTREQAAAVAATAAAAAGSSAYGAGYGKLTAQIPLPDADVGDAVLSRTVPQVTAMISSSPAHQVLEFTADESAGKRGPGTYDTYIPHTFHALAAAAAAGGDGNQQSNCSSNHHHLYSAPDFKRTTNRDGYLPNSAAAAAAIIAARRLAAVGADGDKLVLNPDVTVIRPNVTTVTIPPENPNHPAVVDPIGYDVRKQQQMGIWRDRLCGIAPIDAVKPRPAGCKGVVEFDSMLGRCEARDEGGSKGWRVCDLDYRVEDIPLTVLAGHRSAPKPPAFDYMLPRAAAAAAGNLGQHQVTSDHRDLQITAQPGDLIKLNPAAAADVIRSRAIAGSVVGFDHSISNPRQGLVNLHCQLGRDDVRGSAAGDYVVSAADVEAASWRDYINPGKGMQMTNPVAARALGFEKQLSRLAAYRITAAVPECTAGVDTDDIDAGVYEPKPAKAVWPAAAAAHFGSAVRMVTAAAAAAELPQSSAQKQQQDGHQHQQRQHDVNVAANSGSSAAGSKQAVQESAKRVDAGTAKQPNVNGRSRLQLLRQYNNQKAKRQQQQQLKELS